MKRENIVNNINKAFNMIGGTYNLDSTEINDIKNNLKIKGVGFQSGGYKEISEKLYSQAKELFPYKVDYHFSGGGKKGRGKKSRGKKSRGKSSIGECKGTKGEARKKKELDNAARIYNFTPKETEVLKKSMEKTFRDDQNCGVIQRRDVNPHIMKTHPEKYMASSMHKKMADGDRLPTDVKKIVQEEFKQCSDKVKKFTDKSYPTLADYNKQLDTLLQDLKTNNPVCNTKIKSSAPTKIDSLTKQIESVDKKIGDKMKNLPTLDKEDCKNELEDAKFAKCGSMRGWNFDKMCASPSCSPEERAAFIKKNSKLKLKAKAAKGSQIKNKQALFGKKLNIGRKPDANNICSGPGKCSSRGAQRNKILCKSYGPNCKWEKLPPATASIKTSKANVCNGPAPCQKPEAQTNKVLCNSYGNKCEWGPPKAPVAIVLPGTTNKGLNNEMKNKIKADKELIKNLKNKCGVDYKQLANELATKSKITGEKSLELISFLTDSKNKLNTFNKSCNKVQHVGNIKMSLKEINLFLTNIETNINNEKNKSETLKQKALEKLEQEKKKKELEELLAKKKEEESKKKAEAQVKLAEQKAEAATKLAEQKLEDDKMAAIKKAAADKIKEEKDAENRKNIAKKRIESRKKRKALVQKRMAERKKKREKLIEDRRMKEIKKIEAREKERKKTQQKKQDELRKKEKARLENEKKKAANKLKEEQKAQKERALNKEKKKKRKEELKEKFGKRNKRYSLTLDTRDKVRKVI